MSWELSRFRAGDLVEVRSKEEILATLDQGGCLDGMPFMPEMLQYCGQQFCVSAVAHKTCETALKTYKGRRLQTTVHLDGLRCDGSSHGGCEADCNLFWKDDWLRPVGHLETPSAVGVDAPTASAARCTEDRLFASTILPESGEEREPHYSCQATRLYHATTPLSPLNLSQYVYDVITGNHSLGRVLRVVWLASLRELLRTIPVGYSISKRFHDWMHEFLTGRPAPSLSPRIKQGRATPTGRLGLKPGEYVRIKPKEEIETTVDERGKNRGLSFDPEEMAPYCDRTFKVKRNVSRVLDEETGKMLSMKQPCIILEDVVCKAEYARCRLNCPRAFPLYWREIWLERVDNGQVIDAEDDQGLEGIGDDLRSDQNASGEDRESAGKSAGAVVGGTDHREAVDRA